ncbi:MAG: hotdog fold thioesterase [Gammaproteobacteria bacterium]|nr:hotdog fold thioesterase [Gammaproteobacteria bacterium]
MSIWKTAVSIEVLNERAQGNMAGHLGIEFIEVGEDYLKARMPVDHRTKQPIGIMNGGASCALAESVGSAAANYCVDLSKQYCVGLDINTNHIRSAREGFVIATAKPFHIGGKTQVWSINIENEQGQLISVNRLTMMVQERLLK